MRQMTKAQAKRMLKSVDSKSKRLWSRAGGERMTTADMIAVEKIVARCLKRLG